MAVQVIVALPVILGFGALTIDVGRLYLAKNELQIAADSAALAGAAAYLGSEGKSVTLGQGHFDNNGALAGKINQQSRDYARQNYSNGKETNLADADVEKGRHDFGDPAPNWDTSDDTRYNAVRVTLRRADGSANGAVDYFFATIFGLKSGRVEASATAAVNDQVAAYNVEQVGPLLPFTINAALYEQMLTAGPDGYAYDSDLDQVTAAADGLREVDIYPLSNASGNFGVLDVGPGAHGVPKQQGQIDNNLASDEIEHSFHTTNLGFTDPDGDPVTYAISGTPGLRAALESNVNARVGDVVGIFLFSSVSANGSNATYTIVGIRFVRVMHIDLNGNDKHFYVQPAIYAGPGLTVQANAPSTVGNANVIMLVR